VTQPATESAPEASGRFKRRWYLWAGLAVLILVAAIAVAAVVRPKPQTEYDAAVHDRFLAACTAQGGEPVQDTCECLYGQIEQNVPFDRFELLDDTLASEAQAGGPDQPLELPDDINAMLQGCIAQTG
jgi:hypothetical protein